MSGERAQESVVEVRMAAREGGWRVTNLELVLPGLSGRGGVQQIDGENLVEISSA